MQKQSDKLTQALLACQNEEKRGKREKGGRFLSLIAVLALGISLSVFSFFLYDGSETEGSLAAAREVFSDFLTENEAVAVFLGLTS